METSRSGRSVSLRLHLFTTIALAALLANLQMLSAVAATFDSAEMTNNQAGCFTGKLPESMTLCLDPFRLEWPVLSDSGVDSYRVELWFLESGEQFSFRVSGSANGFRFPPEAQRNRPEREDFAVSLLALIDETEVVIDGMLLQIE